MSEEVLYKVVIIREDLPGADKLLADLKESFDIAKGAYATELSLITQKKEDYYRISTNGMPGTYCLAFDNKNNVLGFILLEYDERTRTLWTSHVYVRPEVRRKGVYRLMMDRVKKFAIDTKMSRIFSIVHVSNKDSIKSHRHVGFRREWIGYEIEMESDDGEKEN